MKQGTTYITGKMAERIYTENSMEMMYKYLHCTEQARKQKCYSKDGGTLHSVIQEKEIPSTVVHKDLTKDKMKDELGRTEQFIQPKYQVWLVTKP